MNRLPAMLLCAVVSAAPLATAPDYEVGAVAARVVEGPDEDGDLLVSLKVVVTNYSDEELTIRLEIQGCDSEGFEVFEDQLQGKVSGKSSKAITDTYYINARVFESIAQWNVEE